MNRFLIYLNERFPLASHIPLISVFTFSAVCYSLSAAGAKEFIPWQNFLLACFLTISTFFILRVSDEFKDHEDDMKHRKYLPVPRGLVTLKELGVIGVVVFIVQVIVVLFYPAFWKMFFLTAFFLFIMYHEFFIGSWLKKHQAIYVFSHMLIIPLVDLLASSSHWSFAGIAPPNALLWFFVVSFFNGIVLEVGRKIKTADKEEDGVVSYTKLYGTKGAVWLWIVLVLITFSFAWVAIYVIDSPTWCYIVMSLFAIIAILSGLLFIGKPTPKKAKFIELASAIWSIGMYLNIGALPFTLKHLL